MNGTISSLDRWRLGIEILIGLTTIVTLIVLTVQTDAARDQALAATVQSEEAAKQGAAQRLDGMYERLMERKEFFASQDNSQVTEHMLRGTPLENIKNEVERARVFSALEWELVYVDYLYEMLPGLIPCVPADGHLMSNAEVSDDGRGCDGWVAWSEYMKSVFEDDRQCWLLKETEATYGFDMVNAIRQSGVCKEIL
ncbi:hypothetical protein [Streptomyces sp. NL15-2K]|uniref:hypothetical protein n=1 Tax=Streptomyces sp. NL15-2K TaxID=376149 RepID=UPI000F565EAC|nr:MULTISPECIES: hypothetical protein [Actinomycetes]WKX11311.1 hypothetical protein Q4V64_28855 [Kutzneria buriramensis]